MNLWDAPLTASLIEVIAGFATDDDARVLVLTSADDEYFIAHADVAMILRLSTEETAAREDAGCHHGRGTAALGG